MIKRSILAVVALAGIGAGHARRESPFEFTVAPPDSVVRVVLLGTGTPIPDPERSGPSTAIVVNGAAYLVDAGPGVVRRAVQASRRDSIPALRVANLRYLFITHLHSDHTLGLPDMMLTPAVMHRKVPLTVYGPPGTRAMVAKILDAYREDIDLRVHGLERGDSAAYRVIVHEVYSKKGYDGLDADGRRYHALFHTSAYELGDLATKARPKLLILSHILFFGENADELLAEAKSRYSGPVVIGSDLDVY